MINLGNMKKATKKVVSPVKKITEPKRKITAEVMAKIAKLIGTDTFLISAFGKNKELELVGNCSNEQIMKTIEILVTNLK